MHRSRLVETGGRQRAPVPRGFDVLPVLQEDLRLLTREVLHGSHDRVGERLRAVDFGGVLRRTQRDCLRFVRLGVETGDAGGHEVGRRTQGAPLEDVPSGPQRDRPGPRVEGQGRPATLGGSDGSIQATRLPLHGVRRATALVGRRGFLERARGGTNRRDGVRVVTHPLALEKSVAVVRRVGAVGWNLTWYAFAHTDLGRIVVDGNRARYVDFSEREAHERR